MPDHHPDKRERAAAGAALALVSAAEAIRLVDLGNRRAAEALLVHAYHDGAPALALVEQYHTQRSAQERARQ